VDAERAVAAEPDRWQFAGLDAPVNARSVNSEELGDLGRTEQAPLRI
jgi:hypothetical protein